jgi:RNA ligase (TIGR02306 family)
MSVRRISDLSPIPDADAIELARIDGWNVVVKKGEFRVGDLCGYAEIDSVLPEREPFLFLAPKKFRIRTIRLRGQLSQGIAFPLTPELFASEPNAYIEGDDITEIVGVIKYEPPLNPQLAGTARGSFPAYIPKTDETRVQNLKGLLGKYAGTPMYVAEKLDGSSMTAFLRDGEFHVCSRSMDLKETEGNAFWMVARQLDLEGKLRDYFGDNVAIQGELIGGRIQGNPLKRPGLEFHAFNLFDIEAGAYWNFGAFRGMCADLGLATVPILDDAFVLHDDIDTLLALADGHSAVNPACLREGLVLRPLVEINDPRHGRLSFKVISNDYLLKTGQ